MTEFAFLGELFLQLAALSKTSGLLYCITFFVRIYRKNHDAMPQELVKGLEKMSKCPK